MNNYDYPAGADTRDTPWNEEDNPTKDIIVTVSITLSKTLPIKVSDYKIVDSGIDEDDNSFQDIDYSDCDLKGAVEEQIILPQDAWKNLRSTFEHRDRVFNDLKDWNVDDFEVILEQ